MHSDLLQGAQTNIELPNLPARRAADDAPRWARTDQTVALWDYATADQLQGDGSAPLSVYFRLAPDLFYNERPNAILQALLPLQFHSHRAHLEHADPREQRVSRLGAAGSRDRKHRGACNSTSRFRS